MAAVKSILKKRKFLKLRDPYKKSTRTLMDSIHSCKHLRPDV